MTTKKPRAQEKPRGGNRQIRPLAFDQLSPQLSELSATAKRIAALQAVLENIPGQTVYFDGVGQLERGTLLLKNFARALESAIDNKKFGPK